MNKKTKQEAGKLGAAKTAIILAVQKQERILKYLESPNICNQCSHIIPYNKRTQRFCNRTCSATHTNLNRPAPTYIKLLNCKMCNNTINRNSFLYCSISCHTTDRNIKNRILLELGQLSCRKTLKKYIIESQNFIGCSMCKNYEWMGVVLPLELDHIDGNAANNLPSNLRVICANCHSITPTWKGSNKGSGRKSRGLPLH